MKLYEIINATECLRNISSNKNLPTRVAYKLYLMIKQASDEFEFFENQKYSLFEKYGRDMNGVLTITEDNKEMFVAELDELKNIDVSKKFEKVDISLDIDLGVSPADIALLEPFINFVE